MKAELKAEEVRLGNLAYDRNDEKIREIEPWDFEVDNFINLSPVPLTEQWLLKFGFNIIDVVATYKDATLGENPVTKDHLIILSNTGKGWFYRNGHHKIPYVHTLQNLYFSLAGNDLTLRD